MNKPHTEESKRKISTTMKNLIKSGKGNPFKKGNQLGKNNQGRERLDMRGKPNPRLSVYNKKEKSKQRGELNPNWKGGITPINRLIRASKEYILWRKSVFERDNYTCVWCGYRGRGLVADHIKPFSLYPELRFDIDNGRTLCEECHLTTDTYAGRLNHVQEILK